MGGKIRLALSSGVIQALEQVSRVVDHHAGRGAVIGGIAVIARGVPRLTRDIDVTFSGGDIQLPALVHELERAGIMPRIPDALSFAAESQVRLMRHTASGVDIDISRAWLASSSRRSPARRGNRSAESRFRSRARRIW